MDWTVVLEAYEKFPFKPGREADKPGKSAYRHEDAPQNAEPEEESSTEAKIPTENILSAYDIELESARSFCLRLGTTEPLSSVGHAFVNGRYLEMNDVGAVHCVRNILEIDGCLRNSCGTCKWR